MEVADVASDAGGDEDVDREAVMGVLGVDIGFRVGVANWIIALSCLG